MAGFWGRRKQEREELRAQDAELDRRASAALVATDERVRSTVDELAYAEIELGNDATQPLRDALTAVKTHLQEAFQLNQLNHDEKPDTDEERRTRNARIVQLCDWAEDLLDDRTEALRQPIERARRAPEIIAGIRRDVERLSARIAPLRETTDRIRARYADEAVAKVANNAQEAQELLNFALHGADVSERRRADGRREQANIALETAIEAVRRARTLIEAVDEFEVEALRAESTLDDVVTDSRGDIIAAREFSRLPAVSAAVATLQTTLEAVPPAGTRADPFTHLTRLREANAALDAAVATARERAARPLPPEAHVRHAIDDADRQLSVARSVIAGHRGWIGADARTRLAEAERMRSELQRFAGAPIEEDDREKALADARRCGMLAGEALQLAQRDIDSDRPRQDFGDGFRGGRGNGNGNVMGGILGGLVIGSILDGIFD